MSFDYDLFVIGAGSGGVRAARMSAGYGARVAVAEEFRVGGTCVIRGCVPKKLFVYASHYAELFEEAAGFGWRVGAPEFDWPTLLRNKDAEIDRLNSIYIKNLEASGVEILPHRAELVDAQTVLVDGREISAERVLIAVGRRPSFRIFRDARTPSPPMRLSILTFCRPPSPSLAAVILRLSSPAFSTGSAWRQRSSIAARKFCVGLMMRCARMCTPKW